MKSIIQENKECWFCKTQSGLHLHHVYGGTANRKISDENGFVVYLCEFHHNLGDYGVHGKYGSKHNMELKRACQREYEKTHTRDEFIKLIGKSYL